MIINFKIDLAPDRGRKMNITSSQKTKELISRLQYRSTKPHAEVAISYNDPDLVELAPTLTVHTIWGTFGPFCVSCIKTTTRNYSNWICSIL